MTRPFASASDDGALLCDMPLKTHGQHDSPTTTYLPNEQTRHHAMVGALRTHDANAGFPIFVHYTRVVHCTYVVSCLWRMIQVWFILLCEFFVKFRSAAVARVAGYRIYMFSSLFCHSKGFEICIYLLGILLTSYYFQWFHIQDKLSRINCSWRKVSGSVVLSRPSWLIVDINNLKIIIFMELWTRTTMRLH